MTTSKGTEMTIPRGGSGAMFDDIAHRYDLLNRIMSMGMDHSWRRKTIKSLALQPGERALDLATGTADLAIRIARKHRDVDVAGLDPSRGMLDVGLGKIDKRGLSERIKLIEGDAQDLPWKAQSFNAISMAFGIRNVPDRAKALREMARVLRPGGRVAILELSEPRKGIMAPFARFHIRVIVPRLGALISGSREYRYLQESIAAFPAPEQFVAMMNEAGFAGARARRLTFGVCQLYTAEVAQ